MNPPLRLLAAFQSVYPKLPEWIIQVPGREMWLAAEPISTLKYYLTVPDYDSETVFDVNSLRRMRTCYNRPLPNWARYTAGAIHMLAHEGFQLAGVHLFMVGEEPDGPRYEYTMGMAILALGYQLQGVDFDALKLIGAMERVQHQYVQ